MNLKAHIIITNDLKSTWIRILMTSNGFVTTAAAMPPHAPEIACKTKRFCSSGVSALKFLVVPPVTFLARAAFSLKSVS
jgi:hypothetical protein